MTDCTKFDAGQILNAKMIRKILTQEGITPSCRAEWINGLEQRAKELTVLGAFKRMLTALMKEIKAEERANCTAGKTNFTLPIDLSVFDSLNCGEWLADDTGVYRIGLQGQRMPACSHAIFPAKLLKSAESGDYKVELIFEKEGNWQSLIVDKSVIASSTKIIALSDRGIRVTSENARALVSYLDTVEALNPDRIRVYSSTSKLGWCSRGFMPYCSDKMIFDSADAVASVYNAITAAGSYDVWRDTLKELRTKTEVQLVLAASFASPYLEKLGMLPFIVDLYGLTGSGKTVCAMLAASVWADPAIGRYMVKAGGTLTSLEVYLNLLHNLPGIIDDFAQIKKSTSYTDFSTYVYMLCSGTSKGRSNVSLGMMPNKTWNNIIITNSEQSLLTDTSQGGMVNRIIEFESEDSIFDNSAPEIAETVKANFGHAGEDFLNTVTPERFKELQESIYKKLVDTAEERREAKDGKQLLPLSVIMAADQLAAEVIFKDERVLDFELCYGLAKTRDEISENDRAYKLLIDYANMNRGSFEWDVERPPRLWYGEKLDGKLAIFPAAFNRFCDEYQISSKSFREWLNKKGYLSRNQGAKHYTKAIRLGDGKLYRCLIVTLPEEEIPDEENPFMD